jgi:hypothetical protein
MRLAEAAMGPVDAVVGAGALLLGGLAFFVFAGFYLVALAPAFVLWQGRLA